MSRSVAMTRMTYAEAACLALEQEMERDTRVWALGEDLGPEGGPAGQYRGLQQKFGRERILDTPISESMIMGSAVGAAVCGTRPVVELRFADFAYCAADEIINQAAKIRYMLGGQVRVPLVIRQPIGMKEGMAAQHSQNNEALWVHVPGLVVVAPSTPADCHALLKAAVRCDDPVMFLEHKELWGTSGDVDPDAEPLPIGVAHRLRTGADVTLVTWSSTVGPSLAAAHALQQDGVSVDVIDLRTLWPWDREVVFDSVARTGRLVVAHETVKVGGFGAELVAEVAEHLFARLKAAPVRVALAACAGAVLQAARGPVSRHRRLHHRSSARDTARLIHRHHSRTSKRTIMTKRAGIVGIGIMGSAMMRNLRKDGFEIIGFDVAEPARQALIEAGGRLAATPQAVAEEASIIITSLPNIAAFHAATSGPDGIANAAGTGQIVIDCSTLPIEEKQRARDALAAKGKILLDCPVSGTGAQAANKDLVVLGSGDKAAFDRCAAVFAGMSRVQKYVGPFGNGMKMKIIANHLVTIHNLAAAEALVLGMKAGLDPAQVYDTLADSAGSSRMFQVRGPQMVANKYEPPTASMVTHLKDIGIIADFAADLQCPTPLFTASSQFYMAGASTGRAHQDTASLCAVLEDLAGVKR